MSLARRHRSSAPAMRGRRPLLSGLLGWVALLALLFGSGAALFPGSAIATAATAQEHPAGGETAPEEETPAKPQRLVGTRVAEASGTRTALPALLAWIDLHWQAAPVHFSTAPANITDPWPAVPGRRVQRGQAPPRA